MHCLYGYVYTAVTGTDYSSSRHTQESYVPEQWSCRGTLLQRRQALWVITHGSLLACGVSEQAWPGLRWATARPQVNPSPFLLVSVLPLLGSHPMRLRFTSNKMIGKCCFLHRHWVRTSASVGAPVVGITWDSPPNTQCFYSNVQREVLDYDSLKVEKMGGWKQKIFAADGRRVRIV